MENQAIEKGVLLSRKEAEEYCAYKRQKKMEEITSAMRRSEGEWVSGGDFSRVLERAKRLRQAAVRVPPTFLERATVSLKESGIKADCLVGGEGETLTKVKTYEGKTVLRKGAKELTVTLPPSYLSTCRYFELRKELRKLRRMAGKATLKVRVNGKYAQDALIRIARLCSEAGAQYFSLPYSEGCVRLLQELSNGCLLEVSGVETLADFKKMAGAGMGRIVTTHAWEIYCEWLKEVEEITVEKEGIPLAPPPKQTEEPLLLPAAKVEK